MCNLPQGIVDVLDRVPMRELQEYLDDRKGKQVMPVKPGTSWLVPKMVSFYLLELTMAFSTNAF